MTASGTATPQPGAMEALTQFALGAAPAEASAGTFETAKLFLADTLGCALAGSSAETNEAMVAAFAGTPGPYAVPGRQERVSRDACAVLTAHAVHCLEWDAVHEPAVVHAMSVTTGALWAELQSHRAVSGRAFLESLIVGVDIASRLGVATDSPLRFFRPATAGLVGAAAAIARLRGLSDEQARQALGLAYCQLQGTMQAHLEGTPALAVQVALSARAALNACDMAAAGLIGPQDVFAGKFGYFSLIEEGGSVDTLLDELGGRFAIDELSIKPYPSGRASHGVLSVLLQYIADGTVSSGTYASITAWVPPLVHRLVGRPMTADMAPAYARLCLPFLVALALRDGRIDPRQFTGETFADPVIRDAAARVTVLVDDNPDPNALAPQKVEIALTTGETISDQVPAVLGAPDNPLSADALKHKFELAASIATAPLPAEAAHAVFDAIASLDQQDDCFRAFAPLIPPPNSEQRTSS